MQNENPYASEDLPRQPDPRVERRKRDEVVLAIALIVFAVLALLGLLLPAVVSSQGS